MLDMEYTFIVFFISNLNNPSLLIIFRVQLIYNIILINYFPCANP